MTSAQLGEWEAFNSIEPIGELRRDFPIAQLTSIFYNFASSFGNKNSSRKVAKPQDFMPWFEQKNVEVEEQSVEEMKAAITGIASVQGTRKRKHG